MGDEISIVLIGLLPTVLLNHQYRETDVMKTHDIMKESGDLR